MLSHIKETDESVPYRLGDWFYSTRTVEGSQYAIHCRRPATSPDVDSPIDPASPNRSFSTSTAREGKPFMAVGAMAVSPDGNLLAYSTDATGFRQYTLHIRDLRTGQTCRIRPSASARSPGPRTRSTLFYTTEDEITKRHDHVFRHTLGVATDAGRAGPARAG